MDKFRYLVARFKEPSTYVGLAALAATFGYTLEPGTFQAVVNAGTGVFGLVAVLMPEGKRE